MSKSTKSNHRKSAQNLLLHIGFYASLAASIILFITGFLVPPMGVIDGSVITAVGILFGFGVLAQLPTIIEAGKTAKFNVGSTNVEIS